MSDYVLMSDSTADLAIDVVKKLGVTIIPFSYSIGDEVFQYYLDERDKDIHEFYENLKSGELPVTSQVNPMTYKSYFDEVAKEGKSIIYLCFTSGLSGSYQSAQLGAEMTIEDYPGTKIEVIDSRAASIGLGVYLYRAGTYWQEGMPYEELVAWIKGKINKVSHWFKVEDLFHLKRGGRLSAVGAVVGSALKIKPILSVDDEGKLEVKAKLRGSNKALELLAGKPTEEGQSLEDLVAVIGHADDPEEADKLKAMVVEAGAKPENIIIAPIGPIIGSHVGAGMLAIAYVRE